MTLSMERPSKTQGNLGSEYREDTAAAAERAPDAVFDAPRQRAFGEQVIVRATNERPVREELQYPDNPNVQLGDAR